MGMNYKRGKQLVIFDTRVKQDTRMLEPPEAAYRLKINPTDSIEEYLGIAALLLQENEKDKIDAIHLIAHGNRGFMQLGKDGLSTGNAHICEQIQNKARVVVLNACSTGSDISPGLVNANLSTLGGAVANKTNSKVIVCRDMQWFGSYNTTSEWIPSFIKKPNYIYDPGDFEGQVFICYPGGTTNTIFAPSSPAKSNIDVEGYIFAPR
jgi:hypothetical protein